MPPGSTTAPAFNVATTAGVAETNPTVTALDTGFVVTWAVEHGGAAKILAQKFTSAGTASGSVMTITTAADHGFDSGTSFSPPPHSVTALQGGSYVVAWSAGDALVGSIVAANGTVGAPVPLASSASGASLASLPDGFVVAFVGDDEFNSDIYVQAFNAVGVASGPLIRASHTDFASENTPVISVLPDGRFVVAWIGNNGVDGSSDVFVEVLLPDGLTEQRRPASGNQDRHRAGWNQQDLGNSADHHDSFGRQFRGRLVAAVRDERDTRRVHARLRSGRERRVRDRRPAAHAAHDRRTGR